jgi:hypothetical protein
MILVGVMLALGVQGHFGVCLMCSLTVLAEDPVGLGVGFLEGDMLGLRLLRPLRLVFLVGVLLAPGYGQDLIWDYSVYPIFQTIN